MFKCAEYFATLLQPLQVGLRHFGDQRGGSTIGALVELRVIDIGDIYHGGEVEIEPIRCEVLRILDALRPCLAGIVGRADIGGSRPWSIQALQTIHRSALLVDGYCQGNGAIALHLLDKPFELLLINNIIVHCEEQDGPYMVLADHGADVQRIGWTEKLDNQHLAELLIEGHILHNQVDVLLGGQRGSRRLCCCPRGEAVMMFEFIVDGSEQVIITRAGRPSNHKSPALWADELRITSIDGAQDYNQEQSYTQ